MFFCQLSIVLLALCGAAEQAAHADAPCCATEQQLRCVTRQTAFCRHVTALSGSVAIDAQCARPLAGMAHHVASSISQVTLDVSGRHCHGTRSPLADSTSQPVAAAFLQTLCQQQQQPSAHKHKTDSSLQTASMCPVALRSVCLKAVISPGWMFICAFKTTAVGIVSAHQHMLAITG